MKSPFLFRLLLAGLVFVTPTATYAAAATTTSGFIMREIPRVAVYVDMFNQMSVFA
jgi:hypothetical protein